MHTTPRARRAQPRSAAARRTTGRTMFAFGGLVAAFLATLFFVVPHLVPAVYNDHVSQPLHEENTTAADAVATTSDPTPLVAATSAAPVPNFVATPTALRGIYMTQCVVGTPSFRADLVKLIEDTELNAVVIDIKDYSGTLAFPTDDPALKASVSDKCGARDMQAFVAMLHEKGIYVIGRITVFQDPYYTSVHPELAVKFARPAGAVWKDRKGLSFIDVGAKPFWDYIVSISTAARKLGFDELNYDYVRYPSDGPMSNIHFDWAGDTPKAVALERFFAYLSEHVKDPSAYPPGMTPPKMSADLFGLTTTSEDDLNIGQVLERTLPYFDYVCPMVYPSHYPKGFNGWENPNAHPYDLIKFVLSAAVRRTMAPDTLIDWSGATPITEAVTVPPTASSTATTTEVVPTGRYTKNVYDRDKIRPWLQDFSLGTPSYGPDEVRAQIKATYDAGLDSWVLWAANNRYTKAALISTNVDASPAAAGTDVSTTTGGL